jgi:hypothetical protein
VKRKLNDDENWLWTELAHSSFDVTLLVRPGKEASDFRALETVLNREILRLIWWRWPLAIVYIPAASVLLFTSLEAFFSGKYQFPRNILQPLSTVLQVSMGGIGLGSVRVMSNRWRNGVELAIHLSQSLPARSTVELLMTVLKWDEVRLQLNKKSLAPVLYHRLADVLMRVEDWKPDAKQQELLQRIALSGRNSTTNEQRYPDALRVAALVTLADEPAALDEKFRARIASLSGQDSTEASVKAAMGEVLRRS